MPVELLLLGWVAFSFPLPLLQAVVMKLGMDSVTSSYFALFEVINHTFGLYTSVIVSVSGHVAPQQPAFTQMANVGVERRSLIPWFITPNVSFFFSPLRFFYSA